jgi:hypothetical protein
MSTQDARQRTRTYLATYILDANLTHDDDLTQAAWISAFGLPDYPLSRVFKDKAVDLVFSVGTASAKAVRDFRQYPYAYEEIVPIEIFAVDKTGITGTKLRWKAEAELRRISEAYPLASVRWITRVSDNEKKLGSQTLYSVKYELGYIRPTAASESFPSPPYIPFTNRSGAGIPNLDGPCDNGELELHYHMNPALEKVPDALLELSYTTSVA